METLDEEKDAFWLKMVAMDDEKLYQTVQFLRTPFVERGDPIENVVEFDDKCDIYLLYKGDTPVATARMMYVPEHGWKISRISVLKESQKQGYGSKIVRDLISLYSTKLKDQEWIYLSSFLDILSFYDKLGFERSGEVF